LHLAREQGVTPDITATRRRGAQKYGFCINLEQPLADDGETGLFARLGWNDGANESFAYTEAEQNVSLGAQIDGSHWGRPADRVGLALDAEELGNLHAAYLGAGGLGFILGDGRLNRRPEIVGEAYYLVELLDWFAVTLDYQFIANPGYNRDRGPVSVISLRAHIEGVASRL
jgi:high affinity Mn2+ porin